MSTRADKALKSQKEKHHAILRELVQEPTNKTCADCLAKGPRWASWSLGVYICIRCAGIHRNLGVHISKVKSVDLDSWTAEQIEHILKWGNKRASEYYECFLPKDFTRPQGNHAVESFIRNKYEKKLYVKKDGEPEPNSSSMLNKLKQTTASQEIDKKISSSNKRRERPEKKVEEKPTTSTILTMASQNQSASTKPIETSKLAAQSHHHKSSSMNDLLSMDHPGPITPDVKPSASSNDLLNFGLFESAPAKSIDPFATDHTSSNFTQASVNNDLFQNNATASEPVKSEPQKSTKDSIMSLYATSSQPQKMFGVPGGVYMQPQMQSQQQQYQQPYNTGYQMNQMSNQMQRMALYSQQPQQQQVYNTSPYNQTNFQQHSMYSGMNQMSGFQQQGPSGQQMFMQRPQQQHQPPQQFQAQQNVAGYNIGQNIQNASAWPMNQPHHHQMSNGAVGNLTNMNFNMGARSSGQTMNNQLWN